jgi:hypothetical protein
MEDIFAFDKEKGFMEITEKFFFKDKEHRNAFVNIQKKVGWKNDAEYSAAIYTLAAIGKNIPQMDDIFADGIDFSALFKTAEVWCSGERALLKLAAELFSAGTWPATIQEIFIHLDVENTQVAFQALKIRYLY